jgi:uncharacterized repeat protein (TIGR03803 family)
MKNRLLVVFVLVVMLFGSFSLSAQNYEVQVLLNFSGTNGPYAGADPKGSLIMTASTLYGFTSAGGASNGGVIFAFDTSNSNYSILASFSTNDTNGSQPHHGYLTLDNSAIIRPLFEGGINGTNGTIFSVQTNGAAQTVDYSFTGISNSPTPLGDGMQPHSGLLLVGGQLYYGITAQGGANGGGVIYSYNASNNLETTLYAFSTNIGSGYDSHGQLIWDSTGTFLLGMTRYGGFGIGNSNTVSGHVTNAPGVIFSFNPASGQYTQLYSFTSLSNTPYFTDHGI